MHDAAHQPPPSAPPPATPPARPFALDLRRVMNRRDNLGQLLVIAVLVFVVMTALNPGRFLSAINIESMSFQFPELGILTLGVLLAMITGGIDLSVVGIADLSGIFAGLLFTRVMPADATGLALAGWVVLGLLLALATGALAGALNSFLVASVGITPILATLGTMQLFSGAAIVITKGYAVVNFPEAFLRIGNGSVGFVPVPFLVFAGCALAVNVLLSRTALGVHLLMIGTNAKAAAFSGIETRRALFRSYMLTGVLSSVAGIVMMARTNAAKADYGESYVLQAILVSVLGGVNPAGGFGTVLGATIAVLSLQFLSSGFSMLRFSNFAQEFTWGVFLLAIMTLNFVQDRRRARHRKA